MGSLQQQLTEIILQMQALRITGIQANELILNGEFQRFKPDGLKEKAGWYVLTELRKGDGSSAVVGSFGLWRGADPGTVAIKLSGVSKWSPEDRQRATEERKRIEADAERRREKMVKAAARKALRTWEKTTDLGSSPYVERKKITPYGARYVPHAGKLYDSVPIGADTLVIPVKNVHHHIVGLQFVLSKKLGDNDKFFWPQGMEKKGSCSLLGKIDADGILLLCEGYATGCSLHEAMELPVAVCWDSGNLLPAAQALRKAYPSVRMVFCADDDWQRLNHRVQELENIGVIKAQSAAKEVRGWVVIPKFKTRDEETEKAVTDFNDLHVREGLAAVREQVNALVSSSALLDWREQLRRNDKGTVCPTLNNIALILENDTRWIGKIAYCEFSHRVYQRAGSVFGATRDEMWIDSDTTQLRRWLEQAYGFASKQTEVDSAVDLIARYNQFHPVRDYLNTLEWDGVERLNTMAHTLLGSPDTPYNAAAMRKWMIGAVARIMRPGAKMDYMLVLEGEQGLKKSTFLNVLAGRWFSDTGFDMRDKDAKQQLNGIWIYELAEMDSHNKAEATLAKLFLSTREDNYRASYARRNEIHQRQVIFAGTTNQSVYLKDPTGARRYWPIVCESIDLDRAKEERHQLWAEAKALYLKGVPWWVDPDEQPMFTVEQDARYQGDAWEPMMSWFLENDPQWRLKDEISIAEILGNALNMEPAQMRQPEMTRVGQIMQRLGWKKVRVSENGKRPWKYRRPPKETVSMPRPSESLSETEAEALQL